MYAWVSNSALPLKNNLCVNNYKDGVPKRRGYVLQVDREYRSVSMRPVSYGGHIQLCFCPSLCYNFVMFRNCVGFV
jgi:hypothetical protein